jgi:hypothetical protein
VYIERDVIFREALMSIISFGELPRDQQEDFLGICESYGFSANDFQVFAEKDVDADGKLYAIKTVFVHRISAGIGRKYPNGPMTLWTRSFKEHLLGGIFGTTKSWR